MRIGQSLKRIISVTGYTLMLLASLVVLWGVAAQLGTSMISTIVDLLTSDWETLLITVFVPLVVAVAALDIWHKVDPTRVKGRRVRRRVSLAKSLANRMDDHLINLSKRTPDGPPYISTTVLTDLTTLYRSFAAMRIPTPGFEGDCSGPERARVMLNRHVTFLGSVLPNMEESWYEGVAITAANYLEDERVRGSSQPKLTI